MYNHAVRQTPGKSLFLQQNIMKTDAGSSKAAACAVLLAISSLSFLFPALADSQETAVCRTEQAASQAAPLAAISVADSQTQAGGKLNDNAAASKPKADGILRRLWQLSDQEPTISTDRNSVTPHPNVVPLGVLQLESGITLDKFHKGGDFVAAESNLRLGAWKYGELRMQVPNYIKSFGFDGRREGTSDILLGVKQEIEPRRFQARGFDLGVILGTSVPTGSRAFSSRKVDPFLQIIAFQKIGKNYTLGTSHSILIPTQAIESEETGAIVLDRNLTYQPTAILFRSLGASVDIWGEYAGQFFERGLSLQLMDFGAVWRPRRRHQLDFRFGVGLTNSAPRAFIGFGYSVLLGKLFH